MTKSTSDWNKFCIFRCYSFDLIFHWIETPFSPQLAQLVDRISDGESESIFKDEALGISTTYMNFLSGLIPQVVSYLRWKGEKLVDIVAPPLENSPILAARELPQFPRNASFDQSDVLNSRLVPNLTSRTSTQNVFSRSLANYRLKTCFSYENSIADTITQQISSTAPAFASTPIQKSVKIPEETRNRIIEELMEENFEDIESYVLETTLNELFEREKIIQKVISDKWLGIIDYLLLSPLQLGCPLLDIYKL